MAAAYLIHVDPESGYADPDGMAQYTAHVGAIIESFGGIYHLRHKKTRVLEGRWKPELITLIEFPSMSKLLEFYESEEYRPWLDLRKNAGEGNIVVIESGAPDYRARVTRDIEMTARTPEELLPMITAAINDGDPTKVVKYFDEEGCCALPDGALVRGHAELLAMYEQRLALQPEKTTHAAKILQAGDVALVTNVWSTRPSEWRDRRQGFVRGHCDPLVAPSRRWQLAHPRGFDLAAPTLSSSSLKHGA